jgi:hypothetical protein
LSGGGNGNFEFYKFEQKGQILEGVWKGTRVGKYGDNGVIEVAGVEQVFTLNTALKDLLRVPEGAEVRVEYLGKAKAKTTGNEFKAFQIFVTDGTDVAQPDDEPPF